MNLIEKLRERRVTRWVQSTGRPPKSDGFSRDALCFEAADEIERLTAERDALRLDAGRYRYLRNRVPAEVLCNRGIAAGCWIDYEDEKGDLILLTRDDADAAIDAAMKEKKL